LAWTLCSKQDVAVLHHIEVTSLQDAWSEMVEGLISEYMGSPAIVQDTTYTETFDGDGKDIITVRRPPIKTVTSVSFSGTSISSGDYEVGDTIIKLLYYGTPAGSRNVEVVYVSGYSDDVPASVRLAAAAMIAAISNHYGRFGADTSLKWADVQDTRTSNTPTKAGGLITHLESIMKSIIRRNKIRVG